MVKFLGFIIEKRKPLSETAGRAGWIGCYIDLTSIPQYGKIYVVKDSVEIEYDLVIGAYNKVESLRTNSLDNRGWLMDVLQCVDKLGDEFTLEEVYSFTNLLQLKYSGNNNVQPKIRQQLQILRDRGFLQFTARERYKKVK